MVGELTREGDEEAVVDGDEDDHEEEGDDGDGGRGDHEVRFPEFAVHLVALLDGKRLELG